MLRPPLLLTVLIVSTLAIAPARADREARRTPIVRAVEGVQDAVVSISTDELVRVRVGGSDYFDSFFRGYYEPPRYRQGYRQASLGSGVVLSPDGYVVTNYHVVRRGARIRVHLRDGRELVAKVVGTDPDSDLAVVKVDAGEPLPAVSLADSEDLMLGETVIAIGNPFGLSHTVSRGIVSAIGRSLNADERTFFDFIQTDASINPGNSGGPLLNIDGQLIGINTAIYGGEAQGIGFAIPADRVSRVVGDLITHGAVREPWLGLVVEQAEGSEGVRVVDLLRASPAAGRVDPGDLIVSVDDKPVRGPDEYRHRLRARPVGSALALRVVRPGAAIDLEVRSREAPPEAADDILARGVGLGVQSITGKLARSWRLPVRQGIVVTEVARHSAAARVGVRPGDVIRAANAVEVKSLDELRAAVLRAHRSGQLILMVQRGNLLSEVAFSL